MKVWHYNDVTKFENEVFSGVLDYNNVVEEIAIKKKPYWLLTQNKKRYIISGDIDMLPIKVEETETITHGNKVYHFITQAKTVKITPERVYDFPEFVDRFAPAKHTNPDAFFLYKMIVLTAMLTRINVRVCAPHEFGKDSIPRVLHSLTRNIPVITPRSLPALEYRLQTKCLVLNELSDITSDQRHLIQSFLLLCGDYSPKYEKPTRANAGFGTHDEYDISNLSILILYNPLSYYEKIGKSKRFFDNMFTSAVRSRFVPFYFAGRIDSEQFIKYEPVTKEELLDWLHTFEYYRRCWDARLTRVPEWMAEVDGRYAVTFTRILGTLDEYFETDEDFYRYADMLYEAHKNYDKMLSGEEDVPATDSITIIKEARSMLEEGASDVEITKHLMQKFGISFVDAYNILDDLME